LREESICLGNYLCEVLSPDQPVFTLIRLSFCATFVVVSTTYNALGITLIELFDHTHHQCHQLFF